MRVWRQAYSKILYDKKEREEQWIARLYHYENIGIGQLRAGGVRGACRK